MCLTVLSGIHRAKKDLYSIKLGEKVNDHQSFLTPFRYKVLFYNRVYKEPKMELDAIRGDGIERGYHSLAFSSITPMSSWLPTNFDQESWKELGLILCKIPKGAYYYLGDCDDVVSDRIIPLYPIVVNGTAGYFFPDGEDIGWVNFDSGRDSKSEAKYCIDLVKEICASWKIKLL